MEDPGGSTTPVWLAERLERVDAAAFPLLPSSSRPVIERADPWSAPLTELDLDPLLPRIVSEADAGRGILVVTDVEEDPVARVHTAVLLARALASRGRRVLLVDADLRYVGLARWAAEDQLDREGLVDALQYGASVSAVRLPTAVEGVEWIGPGSYRPDSGSAFVDEDLRRVVRQLRQQDAIVLVISGARVAAGRFHPWLVHADSVLPAVHLDRRLATELEDLLEYLGGLNVPVLGLITYRGPDETEEAVDSVLAESTPAPAAERRGLPDTTEPAAPVVSPVSGEDPGRDGTAEAAGPATESAPEPPAGAEDEEDASSPVFRWILAFAFLGLVGFVGWWATTQRSTPPRPRIGPPERTGPIAAQPDAAGSGPEGIDRSALPDTLAGGGVPSDGGRDGEPSRRADRSLDERSSAAAVGVGPGASGQATGEGEASPLVARHEGPDAGIAGSQETSSPEEAPPPAVEGPEQADSEQTLPSKPEAVDEGSVGAARAALQLEPAPGWAIHVYSFPDSIEALASVDELRARGFSPVVRGFDLGEKGRWYRVLIGRFSSRQDALAAREPAKKELEVDWVGVARLRR